MSQSSDEPTPMTNSEEPSVEAEPEEAAHSSSENSDSGPQDDPSPSADSVPPDRAASENQLDSPGPHAEKPDAPSDTAPVAETAADAEHPLPSRVPAVVREALADGSPVEGKVIGWNKGGFHVTIDSITAFCPRSQIEIGNPRKATRYVDKTFRFRVLEIRDDGKRIVVSRKVVLEEEREQRRAETLAKLEPGAVLRGRVSSLTDFGAFVDLGGVEGLVHLSELSRRRVQHPSDILEMDQEVEVSVLKVENDGNRISLSMKALEPDPWADIRERYPTGSEFSGKILRQADFGLFVELEPGIEGLVHVSQLPLGKELDDPAFAPGESVQGWVRDADPERQRIALALREVSSHDPWVGVENRYQEGTEVAGTVEQVTSFGVFVLLEPGLSGLLPISQLNLPAGTNPVRVYSAGEKIKAQVMSVDPRRKRISLAPRGSKLEGTRADLKDYQKKQKSSSGMNAMAAAFAKLQRDN